LLSLNEYISRKLAERGYVVSSAGSEDERSAIVVCQHPERSAEEICERLKIRNIIVSARLGKLRIAPHFYNSQGDVDTLIDALPS